eukprot:5191690-Prymnesium_polylepis.1
MGLRLRGSSLKGTTFYNMIMTSCDLRETDLSSADFRRCRIQNSSFAGAKVSKARFSRMMAAQSHFQGLWWFEKMFILQGGYTLQGSIPIDLEDFGPCALAESSVEGPVAIPVDM